MTEMGDVKSKHGQGVDINTVLRFTVRVLHQSHKNTHVRRECWVTDMLLWMILPIILWER